MLEANPTLTPDQVVTILRQTATPMPYEERVVGAGYVDAHNAVRSVMGLADVAHPSNLFPPANLEIVDVEGDQLTNSSLDILSADYAYDANTQQIVYTLTLKDLSARTVNNQWYMGSNFGTTTLFVSAANGETGQMSYEFGIITLLPNGTRNQGSVEDANGNPVPVDSGQIVGNQIIIKVSLQKFNQALGNTNVLGTTSTSTQVNAQVLLGYIRHGWIALKCGHCVWQGFLYRQLTVAFSQSRYGFLVARRSNHDGAAGSMSNFSGGCLSNRLFLWSALTRQRFSMLNCFGDDISDA